jgi:glycine/D-amino acid oxidase-like deaminating enzyme
MPRVAVVGGGLVGASVAYRLQRAGADVCVVDGEHPGQATAAGAGILPPLDHFIGVAAVLPLLRAAREFYPELTQALAEDGQSDTGYAVVGALHVALDEEEAARLPALASVCEERRGLGFMHIGSVTTLDGAAARRLFPVLSSTLRGAVHCSGAARIDARRLLRALRAASIARGARWLRGEAELQLDGGQVTGVRASGELVAADAVVIAGGAWSGVLAERLGLELPVRALRGQLLHLELPNVNTASWPVVLGFGLNYLLTFPENRIVAGATREAEAGYDARCTAAGAHTVLQNALRLAPGLAQATFSEMRVGFRPVCVDGMPVLGASRAYPNLFFATGHGGYGLEVGPYSGALVADQVLGRPSSVDLAPFALERFVKSAAPRPA